MLAARLLLHGGSARRNAKDCRPVETVLDAAAERIGKPRQPHVARSLETHDVQWAWQLTELTDANWERLDVPIGLQTAIRAELADPTVTSPQKTSPQGEVGQINERMRRFLLLPDADGREAKPLRSVSAFFLGFFVIPLEHRQNLLMTLCELIALVGGLLLPITLEFRRHVAALPDTKAWDVPPTLLDVMDAVAMVVFLMNAMVVCAVCYCGIVFAAGAYQADDDFCAGAMGLIGVFTILVMTSIHMPFMFLLPWHVFTDAASPYAAIAGIVIVLLVVNGIMSHALYGFLLDHYALELYHFPRWFQAVIWQQVPWLKYRFDDKVIKPKAEKRAARLRAQIAMRGLTL